MADMLSVDEARERVLRRVSAMDAERVSVKEARNRVLAADVSAAEDHPPFDNSAMDGYALIAADLAGASTERPVPLRVVEEIPAGKAPAKEVQRGCASRIMTGAMLPPGADAVVMIERTKAAESGEPRVLIMEEAEPGRHIRRRGESVRAGERVLKAGAVLRPAEMAMLAALNVAEAPVVRRPRAAVLSTGDELTELGEPLKPAKIRDSNRYGLWGQIEEADAVPVDLGIAPDDPAAVEARVRKGMQEADILIASGGVSVGDHDVVKPVLERMGALDFWRVAMKPGKPQAFGSVLGKPFFGLPGNPVSSLVVFELFVRPALLKMSGHTRLFRRSVRAKMAQAVKPDRSGRVHYMRVALEERGGAWTASLTGPQGSGILRSLIGADGLAVVGPEGLPAGGETQTLITRERF